MNQQKAIAIIQSLLPIINSGTPPENALIKYAHDENMAPAMLEKLGHVFNTVKTINVFEKGAKEGMRGRSFSVIDVPAMLKTYQSAKPAKTKTATAISRTPHVTLEKVAHARILPAEVNHPSWGGSAEVVALVDDTRGLSVMHAATIEAENRIACYGAREKSAKMVREDLDALLAHPTKLASVIADAEALLDPAAVRLVTEHLKAASVSWQPEQDNRVAAWDRTSLLPTFEKLAMSLAIRDAANSVIDGLEKSASAWTTYPPVRLPGKEKTEEEEQTKKKAEKAKQQADQYLIGGGNFRGIQVPGENPVSESDAILRAVRAKYLDDRANESDPSAMRKVLDGYSNAVEGINSAMAKGMGVMDQAEGMAESYMSLVNPAIKARAPRLQRAGEDARAVGNLTRLMMTDPIITEAEPQRVIEIYNTVRQANPEMMADINVARSVLREALQYPHVPLNTLQNLTTTRDTAFKGREGARRMREPAAVTPTRR